MFCNKCGTKIEEGAKFCSKCGNVVATQEAPKPQSTDETLFGVDPNRYDTPNQIAASETNVNTAQINNNQNSNNERVHDSSIRKAIKRDAKSKPKGTLIGSVLIIYAIIFIITVSLNSSVGVNVGDQITLPAWANILEFIVTIVSSLVLGFGTTWAAITVARGKNFSLKDIFVKPFQKFVNIALCYLLMFGVALVFVFTLFIPFVNIIMPFVLTAFGIYFYPALDMLIVMIMDDNREKQSFGQMIKSALELVKGRRVEYYGMVFSFIGWGILGIFTFGILYIWLIPYMRISIANMYRRWIGEASFTSSATGLSNGAVIGATIGGYFGCLIVIIIAVVMFVSVGFLTIADLEKFSNNLENTEQTGYDDVDTSLTNNKAEAVMGQGNSTVTFIVPSDFNRPYGQNTDDFSVFYDKKSNEIVYSYRDNVSADVGYERMVAARKSSRSITSSEYVDSEFTIMIKGKAVKCFVSKEIQKSGDDGVFYRALVAYPIDDNSFIKIEIEFRDGFEITQNNITDYIKVK